MSGKPHLVMRDGCCVLLPPNDLTILAGWLEPRREPSARHARPPGFTIRHAESARGIGGWSD